MKIIKALSAKKVLSMALSLAILCGSLFVANVGVSFNADAETTGNIRIWTGNAASEFADKSAGTIDDPIIISTPEELAFLVRGAGSTTSQSTTSHKYYEVAPNSIFNMNGFSNITIDSTVNDIDVTNANASCNWSNKIVTDKNQVFQGYFNGNGLIIYNLYANGYAAGLFPYANGDIDGSANLPLTISNVCIKNSYFASTSGDAGGILGDHQNYYRTGILIENCAVQDCSFNSTSAKVGALIGNVKWDGNTTINNCYVANNTYAVGGTAITGSLIGSNANGGQSFKLNNAVIVGATPYTSDNTGLSTNSTFNNVYTTESNGSFSGVTTLTADEMKGAAAKTNMALDFVNTWFANTNGAPELRAFHTISATNNGDGTHKEACADCDLDGLTTKHIYNVVDYTNDTSSCICGVSVYGTNDVWDGTKATAFAGGSGTEEDPYIIKTVEQLFLMVRSTGINEQGEPVYYEVADSVNALYINDTRNFEDQAAFVAAASGLRNWSTGLTKEAEHCSDTSSCTRNGYSSNHRNGYVDYFGGRFNGNGVTIYGLYSVTTVISCDWNNGVGFVPMLTGDAVIKNVTFDTNYVKSSTGATGVITSSVGIWDGQYNKDTDGDGSYETFVMCPEVDAYARRPEQCNAAILNVAVSNSYIEGTNYTNKSNISGFVASIKAPKSLKFDSCLFDGTNSTFVDNATTDKHFAFIATNEDCVNSSVFGCVYIAGSSGVMGANSYDSNTVWNTYEVSSNEFTVEDTPNINWTAWETVDGKSTPNINSSWTADYYRNMDPYYLSSRKNSILTATDAYSGYEFSALRNNRGIFNGYNTLVGSGTEEDPYIIDNADTLYLVIASGGTNFGMPQHFKLACNLDLGGMQWVDTETFENATYNVMYYQYQPFAGILDGDGHTIYNLYSADDDVAGFIPYLDGGTVKNLHFRNASVASDTYAGIVTGWMENGATITGCSAENSVVYSANGYGDGLYIAYIDDMFSTEEYGTITDCYFVGKNGDDEDKTVYITEHNSDDGVIMSSVNEIKTEIFNGNTEYTSIWYIGGNDGSMPRLLSNALSQPCADINGDGLGEDYDSSDASALKNKLLRKADYKYIYGDVNGSGSTDMRDLASLYRAFDKDDETLVLDGFWANVKAGNFKIYYTNSDNYDFARRLELYLENATGVDVVKANGSADKLAINLVTSGDVNAWSYGYDLENAVLTFTGGSFTAVEEAVDHFIANTSLFGLPADASGTLGSEKAAVTVNGSPYYYAWGDEFNSDVNGTVSYDNWILRSKGTDKTPDTVDSDFEGIREASNEEAVEINSIKDGKLYLKRGFTGASSGYKYYMSGISSKDSMLFKQGYLEMVATVPADGCAFPAWWLLTHLNGKSNDTIDNSLYSKVYELNDYFDGTSRTPTGSDVTSFKYKLPTQTLEMDVFEIIQRPSVGYNSASKSNDYNVKYNVHKWYTYSLDRNDTSLTVYDLDWANAPASGAFPTKLLTATGKTTGEGDSAVTTYTETSSSIKFNEDNLSSGEVNGAATYQGLVNGGTAYSPKAIEKDMADYLNSDCQITERKYGFLWTETQMSFMIEINGSMETVFTLDASEMNFGDESYYTDDNYGFGQYAYMLIENHIFTSSESSTLGRKVLSGISECDFEIDYVRLYQLDGNRAIITPESESLYDR